MTSDRAELAAARVRSARRRAEQLRERIDRLSAGVLPTRMDVEVARACAEDQRHEARMAQERLAATYAVARGVDRPQVGSGPRVGTPPVRAERGDDDLREEQSHRESQLLRSALVAVVAPGGSASDGGRPGDRRRKLWQSMVGQCGEEDWQGWVRALTVSAVSLLPGLRGAAVSGYDKHRIPYLLGVSDEWTRQAEEIHRVVGEGPAVEAYTSESSVVMTQLAREQVRWPGYAAAAETVGPFSLWALPVKLNGVTLGSVSLYWSEQVGPSGQDWLDGSVVAAVATTALQADLDAMEDGLGCGDPADERISIATGMVVAQLAVSVDEALARMRAFAFSNAQSLSQVADEIVSGSLRLS